MTSARRNLALPLLFLALSIVPADSRAQAPPVTPPANASRSADGLAWSVTSPATATTAATLDDFVTLDYSGWDAAGVQFDATSKHPLVRTFAVRRLFAALQQPLLTMKEGESRRVWIPAELSPKHAAVVYDLSLREIFRPLDAPADVAAIPSDAERSKSGLAWRLLKPANGNATQHPRRDSDVVVHYSGWTTDGKRFDSSFERGEPSSLNLGHVISGWREGLQLMVPGERRRFWIPERLAYRGTRGMPKGMLVFDIELLSTH